MIIEISQATSGGDVRRFQFVDDKSSKFWEIRVTGDSFEVRYGKLGTGGQVQRKQFPDVASARKQAEKLIAEKVGKGYIEVASTGSFNMDSKFAGTSTSSKSQTDKPSEKAGPEEAVNIEAMDTAAMIELASSPHVTRKQLEALVNKNFEVNRVLARHPKAPSKLLKQIAEHWDEDLEDRDSEAHRLIVQNPNASVDLLINLGRKFPSALLNNPGLNELFAKSPDFLDEIPGVLRLPECPEFYLRRIAESENEIRRLEMLLNPALPADIREILTPEGFYLRALDKLKTYADEQENPENRKYIEAYSKISQPYCIPRCVPFDRLNRTHRLDDQAIRGFPFTSANWPWPMTERGEPMQPLAQIDLERAGKLLGADLGKGLLQVWTTEDLDQMLRIIPVAAFAEELDSYFPEDAAWNTESGDESDSVTLFYLYLSQMPYPRIEWIPAGRMFPRPLQSMAEWCSENVKFSERRMEQLSERIVGLAIPVMERGDDAARWIHLGGYPSGYGNEGARCDWSGEKKRTLLYIRDGCEEVVFTAQVVFSQGSDGKPVFEVFLTCDR